MWLSERDPELVEKMDLPDCEPERLNRTYRQFALLNPLISGWNYLYRQFISPLRPTDNQPLTILDVGCGGGDICLNIARLAHRDNLPTVITGIDPDPRAIAFTKTIDLPRSVEFRQATTRELLHNGETFHVVLSNHLLHHLQPDELSGLCKECEELATRLVLFNDIRRSRTGYIAFSLFAPLLFRRSYIAPDGRISIRRSFRRDELEALAPSGWKTDTLFPYRLLLLRTLQDKPVQPGLNQSRTGMSPDSDGGFHD